MQGVFLQVFMGVLFFMTLMDEFGTIHKPGDKTAEMKILLYSLILALGTEILLTVINIFNGIYLVAKVNKGNSKKGKIGPSKVFKGKNHQNAKIRYKQFKPIHLKKESSLSPPNTVKSAKYMLQSENSKKLRKKLHKKRWKKFKKAPPNKLNPSSFKLARLLSSERSLNRVKTPRSSFGKVKDPVTSSDSGSVCLSKSKFKMAFKTLKQIRSERTPSKFAKYSKKAGNNGKGKG